MDLAALIRDVPDFPEPGILFRDITPLLADANALQAVVDILIERYKNKNIEKVVGIESRGFIFGAPLACALRVGFIPARKPGKLPHMTVEEAYALEYGTSKIAMHADALRPGERVLIVDDLIATGGTLGAACKLVERLKGVVVEIFTLVELTDLKGREKLGDRPFHTLIKY